MTAFQHDREQLGAFALGVLDQREADQVRAHLAQCPDCRHEVDDLLALRRSLDEIPPEAFLEGPPDSDLVLQRTLRKMSSESAPRRGLVAAGVAVLAAVALGGAFFAGRTTAPEPVAAPPPTTVPGTRAGAATDPDTGAVMSVKLVPQAGWVRVNAMVKGAPVGARCELRVVSKSGGESVLAGSWLVSEKGARDGTSLDGSALIDPDDVAAVEVVTTDGRRIVSASV
ncbi:anti-sigma factor [Alloactinosynnema sp. L-07]|uniref:anti-sigma factor family protein n=1 Tax=Alloactinosynnema sp. L-07 TaxID=1653480 RepID=UPI0006B4E79C|nr:zf-HC2 domain-containing protein [Alloactinosynnema sp. L-07]